MIGCRCKVGDGLSRAVLITRKLSGVVFIAPREKGGNGEAPKCGRSLPEALRKADGALRFSKLALKEFKPAFPEISFNLITGAAKSHTSGTHTENELRWL